MKKTICIFEDEHYSNLLPLVYLRPVYDLRCGIETLLEKIRYYFKNYEIVLHSRKYLNEVMIERFPESKINLFEDDKITFVNGRLLINKNVADVISKLDTNTILTNNNTIIAANISQKYLNDVIIFNDENILSFNINDQIKAIDITAELINYPWDLINNNGLEIESDYKRILKGKKVITKKFKNVSLINQKNIFIGRNTIIDPYVVLDASEGPIYIGDNIKIMPHSAIKGPAFIGNNSVVKMHAAIYQNTSIGETCKVGGEIESSIIHSFTNKQHEGFLGHSYLGSWINIGASTNNSDLKNNYEPVDVYINNKLVNSGSRFVGLIMGDHSKTAINTMFNTGSVIGISCNIFGAGFPNKYLPSFTWGGSQFLRTNDISKSLEVAEIVTSRRNVNFSQAEKDLLTNIYNKTKPERDLKKMG